MADDDWFRRWWDADLSWEGLAKKAWYRGPGAEAKLQDYWADQATDLVEFGGRRWTRYHLPLHDLDGKPSQKAALSDEEIQAFHSDIIKRATANHDSAPAALDGIVTAGGISFADEEVHATFIAAIFSGSVNFQNANFVPFAPLYEHSKWSGVFPGAVFLKGTNFQGAKFPAATIFSDAFFFDEAFFGDATFSQELEFADARFLGWAIFQDVTFSGHTIFGGTRFHKSAVFTAANFSNVHFDGAVFSEGAYFVGVLGFHHFFTATFTSARFEGEANFTGRAFLGLADFSNCYFGDIALFHDGRLRSDTSFLGAQFRVSFSSPEVMQLENEVEHERVNQENATQSSIAPTGRRRGKLRYRAPYGRAARWLVRVLPFSIRGMPQLRHKVDLNTERFESAFRTLRNLSADAGNTANESRFYSYELDARRRRTDIPLVERSLAALFRWSSVYGTDIGTPVSIWLSIVALCLLGAWAGTVQHTSGVGFGVALAGLIFATLALIPDIAKWVLGSKIPRFVSIVGAFAAVGWVFSRTENETIAPFVMRQFVPPPQVWSAQEMTQAPKWVTTLDEQTFDGFIVLAGSIEALSTIVFGALVLIAIRRKFQLN